MPFWRPVHELIGTSPGAHPGSQQGALGLYRGDLKKNEAINVEGCWKFPYLASFQFLKLSKLPKNEMLKFPKC